MSNCNTRSRVSAGTQISSNQNKEAIFTSKEVKGWEGAGFNQSKKAYIRTVLLRYIADGTFETQYAEMYKEAMKCCNIFQIREVGKGRAYFNKTLQELIGTQRYRELVKPKAPVVPVQKEQQVAPVRLPAWIFVPINTLLRLFPKVNRRRFWFTVLSTLERLRHVSITKIGWISTKHSAERDAWWRIQVVSPIRNKWADLINSLRRNKK